MAAASDFPDADEAGGPLLTPRVVVDATRLARVASWPSQWTPGQVGRTGGPRDSARSGRPWCSTGSRCRSTVDNQVQGDFRQLGLSLTVLDDKGALRDVNVGPFKPGRSTATAKLPACQTGCQLETISFGGPSALVEAMHGTATIESFTVDGAAGARHPRRPLAAAAASLVGTPPRRSARRRARQTAHLTVTFRARGPRARTPASARPTYPPSCRCSGAGCVTEDRQLPTGSSGLFKVRSGRHRRVDALPRALRDADRLHAVRPQHLPGQQHDPGVHLGPRRHPEARARPARGRAACPTRPDRGRPPKHAARPGRVRPRPAAVRRRHRAGDPARACGSRGQPRRPAARRGAATRPRCAWSA